MMNIRDYFLINKTKKVNKIKILDLLGFESDTLIEASSYSEEVTEVVEELNQETFETLLNNTEEIYVQQSSIESYIASTTEPTNVADLTPTDTFNPLNITEQIQRVWSDLESRRKWVLPAFISISMVFVLTIATNTYLNYRNSQEAVVEEAVVVTNNSNELVALLPDLIEISTNTFYSYRISISEVLIYGDLPTEEDSVNIEEITSNLSNIIAQSKVNIATLPDINEFEKHKSLVKDAVTTAENLHGRYLGALRNNEYEVAQSISQAILLNKETESRAFENALLEFKEKSLLNYANFNNLP